MTWHLTDTQPDTSRADMQKRAQEQVQEAFRRSGWEWLQGNIYEDYQWSDVADCFREVAKRLNAW